MSADTIIKPDKETKAETKPGNYFVSNYPPFSFWKEEEVPMVESMLNSPTPWNSSAWYLLSCSVLPEALSFLLLPSIHR
jgi:hypothetical protein